eukprot:TRINITY_DN7616_c0_g3_i1.p1 TRINITY_DN7616_c0_g3~~TRINITY_DN7616_c0_g3_i1.p1  ORF type:complete len:431 (+),score=65.88 TRINITY_DN7616_c0_g3_i1:133-1425(+)
MTVAQLICLSVFLTALLIKAQCLDKESTCDGDESAFLALQPVMATGSSQLKELQAQNAELQRRITMLEMENQELKKPSKAVAMDFMGDGNVLYKDSTKQRAPRIVRKNLAGGAVAEAFWQGSSFGALNTKLGPPPMLRVSFAQSLFKGPRAFATATLMVIIKGSVQVTANEGNATITASTGAVVWVKAGALWNAAGDATCLVVTLFESLTSEKPSSSYCYEDTQHDHTKSPSLSVAHYPDDETGGKYIWPFSDNTNHATVSQFSPSVNDSETGNVVFIRNCPGCAGSDNSTLCMGCSSETCQDWTDLHFHADGILYIPVNCPANTYTNCSVPDDVFVFSDNYTTKEINCQITVGEARYMMPQRVYTERPSRCAIAINGDLNPVVQNVDGLASFSSDNAEVCLESFGRYTTRLWYKDDAQAPKNKASYYMS